MKLALITAFLLVLCPLAVFSQTACISQEAANKCAENARMVPALEAKIATLEAALVEKDKNVKEIQDAAKKNEQELKQAITNTQTELAVTKGQLIGSEAMVVRLTTIIDFMLKNGREKCYGLICIQ